MHDMEMVFRYIFIAHFALVMAVRIYYQKKIRSKKDDTVLRDKAWKLALGLVAIFSGLIFGVEYAFFPGTFSFAYIYSYSMTTRWVGVALLAAGLFLLWASHYYLGKNFNSLVHTIKDHKLINNGPYKLIRHPIYTAYFCNFIGGGLTASNIVLTIVPFFFFFSMIMARIDDEEQVLIDKFGDDYRQYITQSGRFLPKFI